MHSYYFRIEGLMQRGWTADDIVGSLEKGSEEPLCLSCTHKVTIGERGKPIYSFMRLGTVKCTQCGGAIRTKEQ